MPPRLNKNQHLSTASHSPQKSKLANPLHHHHLHHQSSSLHQRPLWPLSRSGSSSHQTAFRHATEEFAQAVHLVEGFADTLDAIPPSLTRSLSDLKELDAVLSDPLNKLHSSLDKLLLSISQPESMRPEQRLEILRSIVADVEKYKLGGEDKIRVANGTGESLSRHIRQLDTTTSLLISSLPPSLEDRLPVSTFPTGYPQLTGSLRAKPIGGVWNDPGGPDSQQASISPPSVSVREFVNFEHDSPARRAEQVGRPFDPQPLPKRPRITQSVSSSQLGLPSTLPEEFARRGHSEAGGVLLDQHMLMLAQPGLKRRPPAVREDSVPEPMPGGPARAPKPAAAASLAPPMRDEPSLGLPTPPTGTFNGPTPKNKRPRVSSGAMAELETDDLPPSPRPKLAPYTQARPQPGVAAPKKRVRKSNQVVPPGKPTGDLPHPVGTEPPAGANTADQQPPALAASQSAGGLPQPPKQPPGPLGPASGSAKKTSSGRHVNGVAKASDEPTVLAGPPAKRSYTKRNGLINGINTMGQAKGKRAGVKKASGEPGGQGSVDGMAHKAEGERARKGGAKEMVRLEDVAEGARGRQRKTTGSGSGSEARREKDTRKHGSDGEYTAQGPGSAHGDDFERGTELGDVLENEEGRLGGPSHAGHTPVGGEEGEYGDTLENQSQGSNHTSSTKAYCICKGEVFGERMVACDNAACPIEWFHYQCAGLTEDPTGSWFCAACEANGHGSTEGSTKKRGGPGDEAVAGEEDSRRVETNEMGGAGERRTDGAAGSGDVGATGASGGTAVKVENGPTAGLQP